MKVRNYKFTAAVSILFLLTGLQSVRANDDVQAIAIVVGPYNNEQFYVNSGAPNATALVPGSATYRAKYTNNDPSGTPDKAVEIKCTYTLRHSTSVGTPQTQTTDDSFVVMPGVTKEVDHDQDASGDFEADVYETEAHIGMTAITANIIYMTPGTNSNHWTVNPFRVNPPSGFGCQFQRISPKKSRFRWPMKSHIAP